MPQLVDPHPYSLMSIGDTEGSKDRENSETSERKRELLGWHLMQSVISQIMSMVQRTESKQESVRVRCLMACSAEEAGTCNTCGRMKGGRDPLSGS